MADDRSTSPKPDRAIDPDDLVNIEQLALKTGITGEQAQDLVDRLGNDRQLLEQAARSLKNAG